MYCPSCDKSFSPVHSRCPECKGWLKVSAPEGGKGGAAAPAAMSGSARSGATAVVAPTASGGFPSASAGFPSAAPSASAFPAAPAAPPSSGFPTVPSSSFPTAPAAANGFPTVPSSSFPSASPASGGFATVPSSNFPTAAPTIPVANGSPAPGGGNGFGNGGKSIDWAEPTVPVAAAPKASAPPKGNSKGGLDPEWWGGGSSTEGGFPTANQSGIFKAPVMPTAAAPAANSLGHGWQSPAETATVTAPAPAAGGSSWGGGWGGSGGGGLGSTPAAPAASAAPAAPGGLGSGGGWGSSSTIPTASGGLGGGGLGGGSIGGGGMAVGGGLTAAPAATGGGWSAPAAAPVAAAPSGGSWLGGDGPGSGPVSAPSFPSPSTFNVPSNDNSADTSWAGSPGAVPASSLPPLELPDHTVPVDLGTPWEESDPARATSKLTNMLLGGVVAVVASCLLFVGYKRYQLVHNPPAPVNTTNIVADFTFGDTLVAETQKKLKSHDYDAAAQDANDAYTFFSKAPGVSPGRMKEVVALQKKANLLLADLDLVAADKALKANNLNQAITSANAAEALYREFKAGPEKINKARNISAGSQRKAEDVKKIENPEPPPPAPEPEAPPTIGDDSPSAPIRHGGGGGHYSRPAAAPVAADPPKPRPHPQSNYVAPRPQENYRPLGRQNAPTGY